MKFVTVQVIPGTARNVQLEDNATVEDAIRAAEFTSSGFNVSISNDPQGTVNSIVKNGAEVMLTRQVKGA